MNRSKLIFEKEDVERLKIIYDGITMDKW
jgi:hypothetical protein